MNYVLLTICGISAMIGVLLAGCEKRDDNVSFKEEGKERLSEREDFKDFPQASDLFIDLDLSLSEVCDISSPRDIQVYPDFKIIRKIFTHTRHPVQFLNGFLSKKICITVTREKEIDPKFLAEVNPVLREKGLPEIRKQDISSYWFGSYRIENVDDFWYNLNGVTLKNGTSFILFTKIPKEVL